MYRKNRRGPRPIVIFLLVWLICSLALPLYRLIGILFIVGLSVAGALFAAKLLKKAIGDTKEKEAAEAAERARREAMESAAKAKAEEESKYSPAVREIIKDGRMAIAEMSRLRQSIPDADVKRKIDELMTVSDKIICDAMVDEADVPQIRKFLNYYMPTTIKLLNAYDRMSAQGVEGENITSSMKSIEEMLDTTIAAYKKQLDALFANQANDIQLDIEALNGLLAREGLGGKSYLDLKDFMKQYNNEEQKGSTANG